MSKNNNILRNKDVEVEGKVSLNLSSQGKVINICSILTREKEEIEKKILEAKKEQEKIIEKTKEKEEIILKEAHEKAKDIEKKAYECGYEQGLKNGYEDGYKEVYEQNIEKAIKESEAIKEQCCKTLLSINKLTNDYIKENKEEILNVSIAIAEQVLREKFEDVNSMNEMIEKIIKEYDLKKDLIIKTNPIYTEKLEADVRNMSNKLHLTQKIFVIPDSNIDKGNAEIETSNGRLVIGIDSVLEKVRAELL